VLSYRLRWYALETTRVLRRRWQALLLGMLLLSPAMMPVLAQTRLLGAPVLAPLTPGHDWLWRYACLLLLEGLAVLWVLIQRPAIAGGPFAAYLRALPIPRWQRRLTDLAVLLLVNTPILLPVLAAAISFAVLPHAARHYFYLIDLLLLTLAAQVQILARSRRDLPLHLLANLSLVAGMQGGPSFALICSSAATVLALTLLFKTPDSAVAPSTAGAERAATPVWLSRGLPPALRVSLAAVRHPYRYRWLLRALTLGAGLVGADLLMTIWQFDLRARGLMLLCQAAVGVIAAGGYRDLGEAHRRAASYTRALPLKPHRQAAWDTVLVMTYALPFYAALPLLLLCHHALDAVSACADLLSCIPLLLLLRLAHRHSQAVVLGSLLAACWTCAVWRFLI